MPRILSVVLVLLALSFALATPAHAVLITINFTATGAAGDPVLGGISSSGYIEFDSSIIPVGGGQLVGDYITGSSFVWNGVTWNKDNTVDSFLFNPDGSIGHWEMVGQPNTSVNVGTNDIRLHALGFVYSYPGATRTFTGAVTWSYSPEPPYGSAPEPAAWMLLGSAMLGLVAAAPRRKR